MYASVTELSFYTEVGWKTCGMSLIPLNLLRFIFWPGVWSILVNIVYALGSAVSEKNAIRCQCDQVYL
jgi:hypothetical protein